MEAASRGVIECQQVLLVSSYYVWRDGSWVSVLYNEMFDDR